MENISTEILEGASHGDTLASGYFMDGGATNICNTKSMIKWVAVRGFVPDWTIYFENIWSNEDPYVPNLGEWSDDKIKQVWDKFPKSLANELLNITPEAYAMYRE